MVGKVKDVVPTPARKGRFLIQFSEYALVNVPDVWKGDRNPVRYVERLEDLGIDPLTLKWKPMPAPLQTAELSSRIFCIFRRELSALPRPSHGGQPRATSSRG